MPAGQNAVAGKQGFQTTERPAADIAALELPAPPLQTGPSSLEAFDQTLDRDLSDEEWARVQPLIDVEEWRALLDGPSPDQSLAEWRERLLEEAEVPGEACSHCGADLADNEGCDGLCDSCADRTENGEDLDDDDQDGLPHFAPRAIRPFVPNPAEVWAGMEGHVRSLANRPAVAKAMEDDWFSAPVAQRTRAVAAAWKASEGTPAEITWHQTVDQPMSIRMAAVGKATHSLISSGGYTQEHYDTLTGPWRRARISTLTNGDAPLA